MKTRSYFEEFLHLTNPRTLKEDVEINVKEPGEDDTEAADGAVVAPIIDPEMGYDTGDMNDTQVEQDGSAYIGKSVVDCHVCNNAFFIDGMEIPEELVCPVCAAPAADLELVGIVEPIPEEEPATTDNSDEQDNDSDNDSDEQEGDYESEGSDEDDVEDYGDDEDMDESLTELKEEDSYEFSLANAKKVLSYLKDKYEVDLDDDDVAQDYSNFAKKYKRYIGSPIPTNIRDAFKGVSKDDVKAFWDAELCKYAPWVLGEAAAGKAQRASGVVKTTAKANINKGKAVAESRQAMSKKIKDIYESRRAAQNTQVKKI